MGLGKGDATETLAWWLEAGKRRLLAVGRRDVSRALKHQYSGKQERLGACTRMSTSFSPVAKGIQGSNAQAGHLWT